MDKYTQPTFSHRTTQKRKYANDKAWYKYFADYYSGKSENSNSSHVTNVEQKRKMKINYDLFNNIIDEEDFKYVTKPYGDEVGELPASFSNRDICSQNIKVMLGMEMKRPFDYRLFAVNEEATSRREQEQFSRVKEYVESQIMSPIIETIQQRALEQQQGTELSPEQIQQLQEQIAEETKRATPPEVKKYMSREHQDPAEAMGNQLLSYIMNNDGIQTKFNHMFKHMCLGGINCGLVTIVNGKPTLIVTNPLDLNYDNSPGIDFIQDGQFATCIYHMTPDHVVTFFSDSPEGLSDKEIDDIYTMNVGSLANPYYEPDFSFNEYYDVNPVSTIPVHHVTFKSLRKIGFLKYYDEYGQIQELLVNEDYTLQVEHGDIDINWEWIPEAHEAWIIGSKYYKKCRPIPGQFKDLNNIYICNLPYYGAVVDSVNSELTSPMERQKHWQYLYNVVIFRIEQLMASDKGKQVFMNIGMIPKSSGIDIKQFVYYQDALKIGFMNPSESSKEPMADDISKAVKEVDLSLGSDIQKYMMIADYIERRCSLANGITDAMRGMTASNEAVTNNQMNYNQSSYILEPYYELHNQVKKFILSALLEQAKVAYQGENSLKLPFVLDDMSLEMLSIDLGLLDSSTFGLFIANSGIAFETKQLVLNLAQAALQNQKAELSDVIKVARADSVQEAEELLNTAEQLAQERSMEVEKMRSEEQRRILEQTEMYSQKQHERDIELVIIKEEEKRKTDLSKQVILSLGFSENKDVNQNKIPDVLEVYNAQMKTLENNKKLDLEERKFQHKEKTDKEKLKIEKEKLNNKKNSN